MPYFKTPQEWLEQSTLLVKARPSTTRISTKYTLSAPSTKPSTDPAVPPPQPRGDFTLKTFDPASGVTLKYKTNKAAEIGHLMKSLSKIGREMAALPELKEDAMDVDEPADAAAPGSGVATPSVEKPAPAQGGGGKKKKKGKK